MSHATGFTRSEGRKFGLSVGAALLMLSGLPTWRGHTVTAAVTVTLAALLLTSAVVIPARLGPVYRAWMGFAEALSRVTTPIFMSVMYFVVLTPVGLCRRAFGRTPLTQAKGRDSYWRGGANRRSDLRRQF